MFIWIQITGTPRARMPLANRLMLGTIERAGSQPSTKKFCMSTTRSAVWAASKRSTTLRRPRFSIARSMTLCGSSTLCGIAASIGFWVGPALEYETRRPQRNDNLGDGSCKEFWVQSSRRVRCQAMRIAQVDVYTIGIERHCPSHPA